MLALSFLALLPATGRSQGLPAPIPEPTGHIHVNASAGPAPTPGPAGPGPFAPPSDAGPIPGPTGPGVVAEEPGYIRSFMDHMRGYADPENASTLSVHQLACLIDHLDKRLYCYGMVTVKAPDIWGQNRLTQYRAEFEDQMHSQLANFEIILNSYQRRADLAALTTATSIGASLTPRVSNSRNVSTTTNVTPAAAPAIPSAVGLVGPNGLVANANTLLGGGPTALLMPNNLTALALANKGGLPGIGLEPTVVLQERNNFLYYLDELRRINIGDDRTDMPGYSLYLVRSPVSILPGDRSIKGKGAMVTVEAKHNLTPDLLANTFRNVVIIDTAYQLMEAITRGQYLGLDDIDYDLEVNHISDMPNACMTEQGEKPGQGNKPGSGGADAGQQGAGGEQNKQNKNIDIDKYQTHKDDSDALLNSGANGGRHHGEGFGPGSEVIATYGSDNLRRIVAAVKQDEHAWFRHDPSVVTWLLSELAAAHTFMREQARLGNPAFQPEVFENIGQHVLNRNYASLRIHRDNWLRLSARARGDQVRPIDVLAFALMVQSVFVDRQLKYDMQVMAQRKGCACGDPYLYLFHALWPDEAARQAFNAYVACKWPIHVFSLDPFVDMQNQLDLFSQRTELQMALAAAVATGQVNVQNATTYARRLEQDLAAINLNRTAVGFGAGDSTYGWQFRPRIQTPPTQSNPRRIAGILINNGPGPDYALKNLQIEPGIREAYALMVVPNFVSSMKLTTVTNWFDLKTCHPDQELKTTDMVCLGRKLMTARNALTRLCDSGHYRPTDLESLSNRLDQLEAMLPIQSHLVTLPFEADLSGSEIFNSSNAGLGPRLLTWFGESGRPGGSVFILGSGFTVHEMKVIVGGVTLDDPTTNPTPPTPGALPKYKYDILSRNVLRIDIPPTAKAILTGVKVRYPEQDPKPSGAKVATTITTVNRTLSSGGTVTANTGDATTKTVLTSTGPPPAPKSDDDTSKCQDPPDCHRRKVIDVHVATANGISNHLLIELDPALPPPDQAKIVETQVTTTTAVDAATGSTTTNTKFTTNPPGVVLPPGTVLPMGSTLPAGGTFVAPGAGSINVTPSGYQPGTVPSNWYPPTPAPPAPTDPNAGASIQPGPTPAGEALADRAEGTGRDPVMARQASYGTLPAPTAPLSAFTAPVAQIPPSRSPAVARPAAPHAPITGAPRPLSGSAAGRVDANVLPASARAPRDPRFGLGILTRTRPSGASTGTTLQATLPATNPPARRSLLSRFRGDAR